MSTFRLSKFSKQDSHLDTLKREFGSKFDKGSISIDRGTVFKSSNSEDKAAVESDWPSVTRIRITGTV